jgi:hypothetical protein
MDRDQAKPEERQDSIEGDNLPYGYGHPAHKPDPNAKYGFEPGDWRPLRIGATRRWRVPG